MICLGQKIKESKFPKPDFCFQKSTLNIKLLSKVQFTLGNKCKHSNMYFTVTVKLYFSMYYIIFYGFYYTFYFKPSDQK